jgi:hypothetical protein
MIVVILDKKCQEIFYKTDSNIQKFNNHTLECKNLYE